MNKDKNETWISIVKVVIAFLGAALFMDFYYPFGPLAGAFIGWYFGKLITGESTPSKYQSGGLPIKNNNRSFKYLSPGDTVDTFVVGVSFDDRQSVINELSINDNVVLIRRPNNPHDKNAIEVCAFVNKVFRSWEENDFEWQFVQTGDIWMKYDIESVGFINREMAARIAPFFDDFSPKLLPILGKIIHISTGFNKSTGLEIRFRIPNKDNLELAKTLIKAHSQFGYPFF